MTAKVNLKLAKVNRLSRSQDQSLACLPAGFNFILNPKLLLNSAERASSDYQSSSIIFTPPLLGASKFNSSVLSYRGAEWK